MSISEPFIRRPVATSLLMAGVILLGTLGYKLLPISALPTVDFPTIEVTTFYPGASADVMVSSITTPLERQFGQISGLASMNSTSSFGTSTITLQFALDRPIDVAAQDVQAAINVAGGFLPQNLPNPPKYNKVNPADTPILTLSITSDSLPLDRVNDYADTLLAQKLSEVTGVGLVTIQGNQKPAVRVQVNPATISALGLSLEDVRTILGQANVNAPKGSFDGPRQSFTIGSNDQIFSADAYKPIIIAYKNGAPVRLGDIANIIDSVENDQLAAWVGTKSGEQPAVLLDIQRQPGANIIQTVERVKQVLPRLTSTLPPSVHVDILADFEQFGGVSDSAPAHIGDVQQSIDTVEVDEGAEIGDVLDCALANISGSHFGQKLLTPFGALLLDELTARENDVLSFLVYFNDFKIVSVAHVLRQVLGRGHIDLRCGQKRFHPNVH